MCGFLVIAHRGACYYEPENTLRSIGRALKLGAEMVEVDVRLSKDGEVVVIHDESVDRTTNGSGYVRDMSLKELKKLDAGFRESIPTLREVLGLVKGKATLAVELKEEAIEDKVVGLVEEEGFEAEVLVTSFLHDALRNVKGLNPEIKTGVIFRSRPVNPVQLALDVNADCLLPHYKYVDQSMVEEAHRRNLAVYPWTVNSKEDAQRLVAVGVDGIVTDKPDLLVEKAVAVKKVFVAGPIMGMENNQSYRGRLRKILTAHGYEVLDPWEREKAVYREAESGWWEDVPSRGFIKRDLEDIDRCSLFVAYFPIVSAGASMELFYARSKGKKIIVISPMKELSPWITSHADHVFRSFKEFEKFLTEGE